MLTTKSCKLEHYGASVGLVFKACIQDMTSRLSGKSSHISKMCGVSGLFFKCQVKSFRVDSEECRGAKAGKAPKAWALTKFWISIHSNKKQLVKKLG